MTHPLRELVGKLREIADSYFALGEKPGQALYEAATAIEFLLDEVEGRETVDAPPNNEPDPQWAAIRRAIDQFVGRKPVVGKHRAVNNAHIKEIVEQLDAAGHAEAADTVVWLCWHRALDRERERFLVDDSMARARAAEARAERLAAALGAVLEWWPEGSEVGRLNKGGSFAADIRAARLALSDTDGAGS